MVLKIKGDIVGNEWKAMYDFFGIDCTAPKDVQEAIDTLPIGDRLEVKINSGGGDVLAGQEIYSALRRCKNVDIEVESLAASAASVIAMAGHSTISPVGMLMIHNVSTTGASGDHNDMKKMSDTLKTWDEALASAYTAKTGKTKDEILALMEKETWLTADKAVELGFVDAVSEPAQMVTNALGNLAVTPDMVAEYKAKMQEKSETEAKKKEFEAQKQMLLDELTNYGGKLKG